MKKLDNILIIGIGNNTRQDDGLGWAFLDNLVEQGYNEDNLLYKYQLMVEDAELIAEYNTVIFVDAYKKELENGFIFEEIEPAKQVSFSTHAVPPNQILNLCETIYNKTPKAYVLKIEGITWEIEIKLSEQASNNLEKSLNYFNQIIIPQTCNN
ncbi:hydrogenase maturation protease [Lutibacter oricola]|uniref:Hydrogenase maturation protease n=1 Tax=Lutibacter oricola TaxID=762486 RepID=A0A1H3EVV7_9FLAO|nr:hydrogenase maturation protease [Lutibacter oricola]SDX82079.1 hydrogenase maturation protease [Lutibacter oricola]